ncbi:hypothetical protein CVT26_013483 [Gymnopilus dilepis]|uniref:Mitochondrial outer membrane protein IML2 n=1 Tax=Gymnopilus dilepis TaxID=231916 RepID=A0A409YWT2_9AGAR|nr:hypothetical protein CVT26_013483 [Gymnopilus dilepis]
MEDPTLQHPNAQRLISATEGFNYLFSNDIDAARKHLQQHDDPFHSLGLGVCAFLEAALGMEPKLMEEATRCLSLSEAETRKQMRATKPRELEYHGRFPYGLEWEILNADSVVLLGLTQALSESYMGYLQCILYKTVFPNGLPPTIAADHQTDPSTSPAHLLKKPSAVSLLSGSTPASPTLAPISAFSTKSSGLFARWTSPSSPSLPLKPNSIHIQEDGPVEDLIVAGTASGFGLFNLVFSLLPKKVQGLVGFLGFKHDRKLALAALSLASTKNDVHGVFAGLVLMTYYGVVLLLSGYQANEQNILVEYRAIIERAYDKYPEGALWVLNRAKIMRMSYDPEGSIKVLREGLRAGRTHTFVQADMLLLFELAWVLLGQRRYKECAESFVKITEMNSWSHGTYIYIAAGCYLAIGDLEKAQSLLDKVPSLIEKRKVSGKDIPTEVYIKKKLAFYKEKQVKKGGDEANYVQAIKINIADVWNTHARLIPTIAQSHIDDMLKLTPPVSEDKPTVSSKPSRPSTPLSLKFKLSSSSAASSSTALESDGADLDTADELAVRALLLGVNYRTLKDFGKARRFLQESYAYQDSLKTNNWVGGIAMFELAVLDLKEAEHKEAEGLAGGTLEQERKKRWSELLKGAISKLDIALSLSTNSVDFSSRLDSRIAMLRDEIATKKEMVGISS